MTTKTITEHTSDLSGAPAEVIGRKFEYKGKVFTMDLTEKESANIDKQMAAIDKQREAIDAKMAKMLEKATVVPTTRKARKSAAKTQAKTDTAALREFAAANGFEFKGRGRPSKALLAAFEGRDGGEGSESETVTDAETVSTEVETVSA